MAGTNPRFPAERFRDAITFVNEMAAPPNADERATFFFPPQLVYTGDPGGVDADDVPFNPQTTVQRQYPDPVQVPCAVTYFDRQGEITNFGVVTPTRVSIDVLDRDYEQISGCAFVVIHGDKYVYRRTEPPSGLFDVGIYTLWFDAEDES